MKSMRLTTSVVFHYSKIYSVVEGVMTRSAYMIYKKTPLRKSDVVGITKVTYT
jgi:hypothetical protein